MPPPRRLSWKTAHRKNRASTTHADPNNAYLQQLNPYKPSSSLRGSANAANSNSIQDGNFERNFMSRRRLSASGHGEKNASFDNDSLGMDDDLDNILSGIEDEGANSPNSDQFVVATGPPAEIGVRDDLQISADGRERSVGGDRPKMHLQPVDFGESSAKEFNGKGPLHQNSGEAVSRETDTNMCTKSGLSNHKPIEKPESSIPSRLIVDPLRSSDKSNISRRISDPDRSAKSFVDEIIEETLRSQTESVDASKEIHTNSETMPQCKEPPEALQSYSNKLDPIESIPRRVIPDKAIESDNAATNIFGVVHHHHNQADDTISTVTDQTDSPYIFAYKKSNDDDSVSQITSSLAPSLGSSVLKNIPQGKGLSSINRFKTATWMGSGGRPIKRGAVAAGTFGRDRTRHATRGNGMSSGMSVGSGSNGTSESPYQEGSSNLDEIAYAINSTGIQRPRRPMQDFDLCTIDSEKSGVSRRRSNFDTQSNMSTLGNGGGSCAGYSATNGSVSKSSSSRSGGLVGGFAMLARKAERFFLPTSPKVTQRKKFDRSDSLEELLLEEGAKTLPYQRSHDEKDNDIDCFSKSLSTTSYGSHGARSRGSSNSSTQQKTRSARMFRLCLTVLLPLAVYMKFSGSRSNNSIVVREFQLRNKSKVRDKRPEFGPINNHQILSENDPDELQRNRYSDSHSFGNTNSLSGHDLPANAGRNPGRETDNQMRAMHTPAALENTADVNSGPFQKGIDVPFYWHIPRSGGGTLSDVLGSCLGLTLASDAGGSAEFAHEESLRVVRSSRHSFVNIDTYTPKGIQHAKQLKLVPSGLADVVISPLLYDAATIFTPTQKGRMFTMLRHPIERAASLFYFIQDTQWKRPETKNDKLADISIEGFYELGLAENNWMVRFLTNQLTKAELTTDDLETAKQILEEKFLVGLMEKKAQSFDRFQKYFGWMPSDDSCTRNKIEWSWPMKHHHVSVEEGSEAWDLISAQNAFDIMLYEYAKDHLYVQQELLIPS